MVLSVSTPMATRAAFAIAMAVISCRSISAQSHATALGTQAPAATLQRAVRDALERAGPHAVSRSPAPQTSTKASWDAVRQLAPGARVTVHVRNGSAARGHVVAATTDSLTVRTSSGERSVARTQITKVTAPNRSLRVLIGVLGVAGGAAAGYLACPVLRQRRVTRDHDNIYGSWGGRRLRGVPHIAIPHDLRGGGSVSDRELTRAESSPRHDALFLPETLDVAQRDVDCLDCWTAEPPGAARPYEAPLASPNLQVAGLDERTARGHHLPFRAGFRRALPCGREVAQGDRLTSTTMA